MAAFRVGVQLWPQHTTMGELRKSWRDLDAMGVHSLWTWDHFFPLSPAHEGAGPAEGAAFEGWSVLAAMATDTTSARLGTLVTSVGYRNPDLLADMARTLDQVSGGRLYLGLGAGWSEPDYTAYGYEFGTGRSRLADLEAALPRIKARLGTLEPPPAGPLPILVGGGGEKVTLRLVGAYADAWNGFGPPEDFARKMGVLDSWCEAAGRDPAAVERTVALMGAAEVDRAEAYVELGATHCIIGLPAPYDRSLVEKLLTRASG